MERVSLSLAFCSDRPSAWCKENWIHWRALKSAFSVETQLRDILLRLQQVQQLTDCLWWITFVALIHVAICGLLLSGVQLCHLFIYLALCSVIISLSLIILFPSEERFPCRNI